MTPKQQMNFKGPIIDANNCLNRIFPLFNSLNYKFSPGTCLINIFSSCFSFHYANCKDKDSRATYLQKLNKYIFYMSNNSKSAVVVSDSSIRNNVATSISHIYSPSNPIKKTIHHAVNVISTEAELFVIRCAINQAIQIPNINHITIVMDAIYAVQHIFDLSVHPYQLQAIVILKELREFFNKNSSNSIDFWDCSSNNNWPLHSVVDKETKKFNLTPLFPCKSLWNFERKNKCNDIINNWKMTFQASDARGRNFLDLLDNDLHPLEPSYTKGGLWIKFSGHSNSLCARATRAIINHATIGEYCLQFFSNEDFSCPCSNYPIESRCHILHECRRFNNYWNPRRDTISHFVSFLEFNSNTFSKGESIT